MHFSQGKWYPGETTATLVAQLLLAQDGEPIWENGELIADERNGGHADEQIAGEFLQALAMQLELDGTSSPPMKTSSTCGAKVACR